MKQRNYTNKRPNSTNRLSAIITAFLTLITHHCSLITDNRLLITIRCIFVVKNAPKHINYVPIHAIISVICAVIRAIRDTLIRHPSRVTHHALLAHCHWLYAAWNKPGTKHKTTPKLHQNYTEIGLERLWNAPGTPLEHLEQCNSP